MKLSKYKVADCKVVLLNKIPNETGNLTVIENKGNFPFHIRRIYYLYDVPGGEERGGHAHYKLEQYLIAASGSFDVILNDGHNKKRINLNRPNKALHIVPGLWRELDNFSSGSICMVLASHKYNEKDYIRDYNEYLNLVNEIK